MFGSLIIRYTELRVAHHTEADCPDGYGRIHPAIAWEEWVAWKWYLGGFLDRLMFRYHLIPLVRRLVCATWCEHLEMIRGPWSPVRGETFDIPWERSPHPEKRRHQ
jgi:hypothetical protein